MKAGDIVKLSKEFLDYYPSGPRKEKVVLRRFKVLAFLANNLVKVQRLDTKMQLKTTYWREFLVEEGKGETNNL